MLLTFYSFQVLPSASLESPARQGIFYVSLLHCTMFPAFVMSVLSYKLPCRDLLTVVCLRPPSHSGLTQPGEPPIEALAQDFVNIMKANHLLGGLEVGGARW